MVPARCPSRAGVGQLSVRTRPQFATGQYGPFLGLSYAGPMSRPTSPLAARPAVVRWLMVALALAGLGVLHGAHCPEKAQAAVMAQTGFAAQVRAAAPSLGDDVAVLAAAPVSAHHAEGLSTPGAMAGACLFLLTAVVGTALVLADVLLLTSRLIPAGGAPSASPAAEPVLCVGLADLGILRI